jgi:hypothetical protein
MVLKNAKAVGLKIPKSIVTSYKKTLNAFLDKCKCVITKPAIESLFISRFAQ